MHLALVAEMVASGLGDRTAITTARRDLGYAELHDLAGRAADRFEADGATSVLYLGTSHAALPVALFGAAIAGIPFIPLNYRLGDEPLDRMVAAHPGAVMVTDRPVSPAWSSLVAHHQRDALLDRLDEAALARARTSTTPSSRPWCSTRAGRRRPPRPRCSGTAT